MEQSVASFASSHGGDDDAMSDSSRMTGTTIASGTVLSLGGMPDLEMSYHVRVLIPCYKEDLEIVQATLNAIRDAALPAGGPEAPLRPPPPTRRSLAHCAKHR